MELNDTEKNNVRNNVYFVIANAKRALDAAIYADAFEDKEQFERFLRRRLVETVKRARERYDRYTNEIYDQGETKEGRQETRRAEIEALRREGYTTE